MISPAAAELLRRGREPLIAEVWLRAGVASLDALEALLDEPEHRPMRRMALVVTPPQDGEEGLPEWMHERHGEK